MPRYLVPIHNTTGTAVEVEADSPEQAAVDVWESDAFQELGGLCHQCEHEVGSLGDWELTADRPVTTRAEVLGALTATPGVLHPHEAEALADAVMALIDRPADPVPHITLTEER